MKKVLLLLSIVLIFSSCSTTHYYYSNINTSALDVFKTKNGDFVTESDDLHIIYSFFGENAPINIGIYNKSNHPIYIDWAQSSLIINGATRYLNPDNANIHLANHEAVKERIYNYDAVISNNDSNNNLPENVTVIPPKSQMDYTSYSLANFPFNEIPNKNYHQSNFTKSSSDVVSVNVVEFVENDSPLSFKSRLAIYLENPNETNASKKHFEQNFYLSKLMKTRGNVNPNDVLDYQSKKGDFFYVKHQKTSTFTSVVGVIAVSAVAITLEAASLCVE